MRRRRILKRYLAVCLANRYSNYTITTEFTTRTRRIATERLAMFVDPNDVELKRSSLDNDCDTIFSSMDKPEISAYYDKLVSAQSRIDELTWKKLTIFLTSAISYLLAMHGGKLPVDGLSSPDVGVFLQLYPIYLGYTIYQFTYHYIFYATNTYQIDNIIKHIFPAIHAKQLHYFTFRPNSTLFFNYLSAHNRGGIKTGDLFISAGASATRVSALIGFTIYVFYSNFSKFHTSPYNFISLIFSIITLYRIRSLFSGYYLNTHRALIRIKQ